MTISPATVFGIDGSAIGAVTRSRGYGVTDSVGLLAPGAKSASFRDTTGGGTVGAYWDMSEPLSANQRLVLRAFYGYADSYTKFGDAPDLGVVGLDIASIKQDTHSLGGSLLYRFNTLYAHAVVSYDFGHGSLTNHVDNSSGSYSTSGYATNLRIGNVFTLFNAVSYARPAGYVKAAPKPVPTYTIAFDLSGHVGNREERANGFTDSTGFVYGDETVRYGLVGGRAKLFALVPSYGLLWMPYVAATADYRFSFSHTASFPTQVTLPTGDLVAFNEANSFWGVEGGVDVLNGGRAGWRVGAKGFYTASADTNIAGGQLYLKIPLFQSGPVLR